MITKTEIKNAVYNILRKDGDEYIEGIRVANWNDLPGKAGYLFVDLKEYGDAIRKAPNSYYLTAIVRITCYNILEEDYLNLCDLLFIDLVVEDLLFNSDKRVEALSASWKLDDGLMHFYVTYGYNVEFEKKVGNGKPIALKI